MTNNSKKTKAERAKAENYRQARIAAVNKLKQQIIFQWQAKKKPVMFFFSSKGVDKDIVDLAVDELMQQYPGVYFVTTYSNDID